MRDENNEGLSKKTTRGERSRQKKTPMYEKIIENISTKERKIVKKKKAKAHAYKLQSDIEATKNLKKFLKELILNKKVEFTLKEVLGIAKKEYHKVIMKLLLRKNGKF